MEPLISLSHIRKGFGQVMALKDICLDLMPGEVLGLMGDNGVGKSTLIKIISGVIKADGGTMVIKNHPVRLDRYSVSRARALGIETVHQDRSLGNKQPVWRNLFMGRHKTNCLGMIRRGEEKRAALWVLNEFMGLSGAGIHSDAPVSMLSGGERQGLAIGRAVYFNSDIVILDEPCTALAVGEVKKVMTFIRRLKQEKRAVIMVSHSLPQIHGVADRFALIHQGRIASTYPKSSISLDDLTSKMMEVSA